MHVGWSRSWTHACSAALFDHFNTTWLWCGTNKVWYLECTSPKAFKLRSLAVHMCVKLCHILPQRKQNLRPCKIHKIISNPAWTCVQAKSKYNGGRALGLSLNAQNQSSTLHPKCEVLTRIQTSLRCSRWAIFHFERDTCKVTLD